MKLCVILLAFSVIIVSEVTFAKYYEKDLLNLLKYEDAFKHNGIPGAPETSQDDEGLSNDGVSATPRTPKKNQGRCRKDMLIIVDASASIKQQNFNTIKKFLRNLINDPILNVSPEGTNVAFMVFSSSDSTSTKIIQDFNHEYDRTSLNSIIDRYEWNKDGYTRTDLALEIAKKKMFNENSPLNHRNDTDDVILLITDGEPVHYYKKVTDEEIKETTIQRAKLLKNKGVKIIGVGIGPKISMDTLKDISSSGLALKAEDFDALKTIEVEIVDDNVCKANPSSSCVCEANIDSTTIYLKPGEISRNLRWKKPKLLNCRAGIRSVTTDPIGTSSPAFFRHGVHEIKYKYIFSNDQELQCTVKFDVRECKCPRRKIKVLHVGAGDTKVDHEWQVPVPTCLQCPSPMMSQSLSVGEHSMAYKYKIRNEFDMTCKVKFEVKGALCNGNGYDQKSQECCCGVIHQMRHGYECCGPNHFNTETHQCCKGNIQKIDEKCLVLQATLT